MRLEKCQKEKLAIFHHIAIALFSTAALKEPQDDDDQSDAATSPSRVDQKESSCHDDEAKDLKDVHIQFEDWAEDIDAFVDSVNRLPGHTDKDISTRMGLLAIDLKVQILLP